MLKKLFPHYYEPETVHEDSTEGISTYIKMIKEAGCTRNEALEQLTDEFGFTEAESETYLQRYYDRILF